LIKIYYNITGTTTIPYPLFSIENSVEFELMDSGKKRVKPCERSGKLTGQRGTLKFGRVTPDAEVGIRL
jgi:hypothetical protein